jgi:hypothetical protein
MMRNKILLLFTLLICGMLAFSETYGETTETSRGWPISGTPVLQERMRDLVEFYKKPTPPLLKKPIEWGIGQKDTLWAWDFRNSSHYQVPATCRAVGDSCYVFVEDSVWTDRVDSAAVAGLVRAFDQSCKADPTKGIYQIDVETFGNPPDVDGDPRILILLLDIKDDFSGEGTYYGGYFYSLNEYHPDTHGCDICQYSNFREMVYVDCNPLDVKGERAKGVLAHEFQHLIHWEQDPDEKDWINEGCSGYAEYVCGYRSRRVGDHFLANPNNSLTDWKPELADYEQTFMFVVYLAEHYGGRQTVTQLVAEEANGIEGVNKVLAGKGANFSSVFADWVIANYLDQEGEYGYQMFDLPTYDIPITQITSLPDTLKETDPRLEYWAAQYIELPVVAAIQLEFKKRLDSKFLLQVIKKTQGETSVIDFPLEQDTDSLSVSNYDTLTLVVTRTSGYPYPYQCVFEEFSTWVELAGAETGVFSGRFLLGQNFPNPFNATTTILFSLPAATVVTLDIFNNSGQRVRELLNSELEPGTWVVKWDGQDAQGRDLASGVYFYRLQTAGYTQTRQMVLLK